ncbi:MAG TPA: hypothetical protein DDY98_01025 [Ruminococcaceae bacterium]|nr:hypothetical protein [Oscillospiraceae bacterium]
MCGGAFFFRLTLSKGIHEQYGTVSFPIPGVNMELFCLVLAADRNRREIRDYLQLLWQESELTQEGTA